MVVTESQAMGDYSVYLSGKMRGEPEFGFPNFDRARDIIVKQKGWTVISPADMDRAIGFSEKSPEGYDFDFAGALRRDFSVLLKDVNGIVMIRQNWQRSHGARSELLISQDIDLDLWQIDLKTEEISPLVLRVATHLEKA